MKRLLISAIILLVTLQSCNNDVDVIGITISDANAILCINATHQLQVNVWPQNATNRDVIWESSNPSVATVDANGLVTTRSIDGRAYITARTQSGNLIATFTAIVTTSTLGVELNVAERTTLFVGNSLPLVALILPTCPTTNTNVTWESSDPAVATVDSTGRVLTSRSGEAVITVTTEEGGFTATTTVTVPRHCNLETPGWGENLGTIGFATDQTWHFSNGALTQTWSDAVVTSVCSERIEFDGGEPQEPWNADCRSLPGFNGNVFSWCAVYRFQDELCPHPWRVPTRYDFENLDILLGGTGRSTNSSAHRDRYLNDWGGELFIRDMIGFYWSLSEESGNAFRSFVLAINSDAIANSPPYLTVEPQTPTNKSGNMFTHGNVLRCVK